MIKAEIVAHSLSPQGDELISMLCTFPRIILAEVNTHRMLSKNTSSSRAIPFNKMVEAVQNNPFIPIAWQKEHKGMQGSEYFNTHYSQTNDYNQDIHYGFWMDARDEAIRMATCLHDEGLTKQLCNRLLEPFMWTTMLITGSREGWDNFFNLRCPQYGGKDVKNNEIYFKSKREAIKHLQGLGVNTINLKEDDILGWLQINKGQAEIHMMALAECIWDAVNESKPKQLQAGEWHIPFNDNISVDVSKWSTDKTEQAKLWGKDMTNEKIKVATAMCARTSYTIVGNEKEVSYETLLNIHDKMVIQVPFHASPFEHCARAMSDEEYYHSVKDFRLNNTLVDTPKWEDSDFGWCYNLKGFIPYRYMIDNKIN